MSDLLRKQIDDALKETEERNRYSMKMIDPDEKEKYDEETLLMYRDCRKGMWWLENCKQCH